jgi:hypothetical protein
MPRHWPAQEAVGLLDLSTFPRTGRPAGPLRFGPIRPLFSARLCPYPQHYGRKIVIAYRTTRRAVLGALLVCFAGSVAAEEKIRLSFKVPAAGSTYTAQHTLPVGDVPGHEVRIFDLIRTFGSDAPMIGGEKLKEIRSVGYSDYTNLNGPGFSYQTLTLANGDKIFGHTNIVSHSLAFADPAKKGAENRTSGPISRGTGKFAGIQGTLRNASRFDPKTGTNESLFELEYSIPSGR